MERLTPALLAKAFRGELVLQDPNDEPAAALLARIQTARAESDDNPRTRANSKPVSRSEDKALRRFRSATQREEPAAGLVAITQSRIRRPEIKPAQRMVINPLRWTLTITTAKPYWSRHSRDVFQQGARYDTDSAIRTISHVSTCLARRAHSPGG
ncbi:MAG: hypothetical protein U0X75_13030 [Acidobacteriota bacterium]